MFALADPQLSGKIMEELSQLPRSEIHHGPRYNMLLVLAIVLSALLFRYLVARMRHKQILAAIEKGVPLSDLKANKLQAPRWITNITFGIALLLVSPCIVFFAIVLFDEFKPSSFFGLGPTGVLPVATLFLGLTLFAIGVSRLIRGLLQRKVEKSKTEAENTENSTKSD